MTIGSTAFPSLPSAMLAAATTAKLLAEIALLALAGQWVVGLLAGAGRDNNPFYRLLQLLGRPWVRAARWISPPVVLERHLPLVAFLVLALVWAMAAVAKIRICLEIGVALCKSLCRSRCPCTITS